MHSKHARFVVGVALVILATLVAAPRVAAQTIEPATQLQFIVAEARADMQDVLNRFTTEAINASTLDELDAVTARAHRDIDVIQRDALNRIDAVAASDPSGLGTEVYEAKAQVSLSASAAHSEIDELHDTIAPTLPPATTTTSTTSTTTTTTEPPTVTTSTTSTTTTTRPPTVTTSTTSTTTTRPPTVTTSTTSTTTTRPPAVTTSTTSTTTTTTTVVGTEPPADGGGGAADGGRNVPPPPVFDTAQGADPATVLDTSGDRTPVTGAMVESMSVVIPPAVATAALSVPIVLEFAVRTIFSSAGSLVVPVIVLMLMMGMVAWIDRRPRTRRNAAG